MTFSCDHPDCPFKRESQESLDASRPKSHVPSPAGQICPLCRCKREFVGQERPVFRWVKRSEWTCYKSESEPQQYDPGCECPGDVPITGPSNRPPKSGRPGRPQGIDTGRLKNRGPLTKCDLNSPNKPGVWVGPRKDMYLPFLFMRANPGDLGARPVVAQCFWESPDIYILPGVSPEDAPDIPPKLGDVAVADQVNTIYAHIWNFGNATASEVLVEFYWCDPSLGVTAASTHLIAQMETAIGAKGSGRSHVVVKCPEAWTPKFLNGGHECLLVRFWDNPSDLPGEPKLDAGANRHVAQRNIHVVQTAPVAMDAKKSTSPQFSGFVAQQPLVLNVGPLYGAQATVGVERVAPNSMAWLQLHTGKRGVFPSQAPPTGGPLLSSPTAGLGGFPAGGSNSTQPVKGDNQQVAFWTTDAPPGKGEAHVYRVTGTQDGAIFGGYTVVILGT